MQFKLPNRLCVQTKAPALYSIPHVRRELTVKQLLRIMKLTAILLLTAALQVSANGFSQGITLKQKNAPLEKALQEIRKQSGFNVVYTKQQVSNASPVTIDINNVPLQKALDELLKGQPLTYSILDKTIIIQPRITAPSAQLDSFPTGEFKGRVNNLQGEPLAGANVTNKRTGRGTQTNAAGNFQLNDVAPNDIISFSYTGYATFDVKADNRSNHIIILQVAENKLDELVIQAYGTTTRRSSTGAITRVTATELQKQPVPNVLQALEGLVPGLSITQNNGLPGANPNVIIRGRNTISGNTIPLYIIDGVPYDGRPVNQRQLDGTTTYTGATGVLSPLININPSDIESVEVLKDADATAIYGSRAANGVILITTKRGKPGKTKLSLNVTTGAGKIGRFVDLLNTEQYVTLRREAYRNDPTVAFTPNFAPDVLVWDNTKYTDWQKELIGGTSKTTDLSASVSGGDSRNRFLLASSFYNETTIFPGDYSYKRGSVHATMEHFSLDRKFNAALSTFYTTDRNNISGSDFTNIAFNLAPNFPLYDSTGKLYWGGNTANPIATGNNTTENKTTNLVSNISLRYTVLPGLNIKSNFGYNRIEMSFKRLSPTTGANPAFNPQPSALLSNNVSQSFLVEPQAEYTRYISSGKLTALAGGTWQHTKNEQPYVINATYPSDALLSMLSGAINPTISSVATASKFASVFGRINYNWRDKYILNISGRRDGSSNFGDNNKYGNFGAVGAAWVFSEEKPVKERFGMLSYGKLRGSYGSTGSDAASAYSYLSTYTILGSTYGPEAAATPSRISNHNYQWEVTRKLETALELGLFNDRLLINAAWFRNRSNNLLVSYTLSAQTGFNGYTANLPALVQNTGWEFDVSTTNIKSKSFNWTTSINLTIPDNKLVDFPNFLTSSYSTSQYIIGEPLNIQPKFVFNGVDPLTGNATILDANKDGRISFGFLANGKGDQVAITTNPKYYGGIKNTITWKGFQLDVLLQFVKQLGLNENAMQTNTIGNSYNNYVGAMGRWQKPGDVTNIPRAGLTGNYTTFFSYYTNSTAMYSDASFMRVKNVSLSYNFPHDLIKRIRMENCAIYVRGQNLYTFTKYKGYDPETPGRVTPLLRTLYAGIQLTF
ncbi:SusC/RagA family TonB-linked outer membrane protein [Niastella caeni]|uniref:SusC/RagA family TonB-linked outer membrane protein n=1 Tax=Niastella caeni TaxID=2569763 RepID=A0A4S8HWH2_9BACT|nr:SusC/RagA family TonB-linked outer membrane protein [Niastella caeni]THU38394.1 SusC/RagA family TonB-linked outer membrane protein [Niastella caeni]